jgi:hypothetical protein
MDNNYILDNEKALYAKNQRFFKRFFKLKTRLLIKKLFLIIQDPKPYFKRRQTLKKSLKIFTPKQKISESGFSKLNGKDLPHFEEVLNYWIAKSKDIINNNKKKKTKYSRNLLSQNEILEHIPTLEFALSEDLLLIVGEYLGSAPSFHSVSLWWGKTGAIDAGSPFFHLDSLDTSCVRMYLYLSDVNEDSGPFCVIPKKETLDFTNKTGYLGNSLADENVFKEISPASLKKLTGDSGSIFAIDATNSLHYGSRCSKSDRVVMVISYASYYNDDNQVSFLKSLKKLENPSRLQQMAYDHFSV